MILNQDLLKGALSYTSLKEKLNSLYEVSHSFAGCFALRHYRQTETFGNVKLTLSVHSCS